MRNAQRLTACLLVAVVGGCTAGASKSDMAAFTAADSTAVRAGADKWVSTILARDFDGWGSNVSSDVVLYPPNSKPVTGRDAAVAFVKAYPVISKFDITVDEITGRGDVAYDRGTYTLQGKLPDGTPMSDTGSFFTVYHRAADGSWPHSRVMWVSHLPPAAPPAPAARRGK